MCVYGEYLCPAGADVGESEYVNAGDDEESRSASVAARENLLLLCLPQLLCLLLLLLHLSLPFPIPLSLPLCGRHHSLPFPLHAPCTFGAGRSANGCGISSEGVAWVGRGGGLTRRGCIWKGRMWRGWWWRDEAVGGGGGGWGGGAGAAGATGATAGAWWVGECGWENGKRWVGLTEVEGQDLDF